VSAAGVVTLPALVLIDRADGGHLVVEPRRPVWERSALSARELAGWSRLVAAAGAAMLECLPQLREGCVNYWEAGNWALHDAAEPAGPKAVRDSRRVHLHLFGRSRDARHPAWLWGEAPAFPRFADRLSWARGFRPLTSRECASIAAAIHARHPFARTTKP
jgi:diadenosine tetraphosphate (Ap4A) HIT family hydrolase